MKLPIETASHGGSPWLLTLGAPEFQAIVGLARERFGLNLEPGREEFVTARLLRHAHNGGFRSFRDYYTHVRSDTTGAALAEMIHALTTHFTFFFRENRHFELLRKIMTEEVRNPQSLRVWCAAAATGEEAYSLAMTILDSLPFLAPAAINILATDVSARSLAVAKAGVYPASAVAALPPHLIQRYWIRDGRRGCYTARPKLRRTLEFRVANLVDPTTYGGRYRVIFCRNVMIYFPKAVRQNVVLGLTRCLEPGGYLFIGHAESFTGLESSLEYVCPAVYRKSAERSRNAGGVR
ncbi:MAG: protein-glutamate O-methyltransferase CheR [Bryobacteraceae bacterium]|jgi:chemotaxis protein methyltransferase CheR